MVNQAMSRPKLQLALDDYLTLDDVVHVLDMLHDLVDIAEIGTPLIIRHGMKAVRKVKARFPGLPLLADLKIADAGQLEAQIAFTAGADIVTVLALADDTTIRNAVNEAALHDKTVMADLIAVGDVAVRAQQLDILGVDLICVHTATDVRTTGANPLADLERVKRLGIRAGVAVAGGVTPNLVAGLELLKPEIVVVGSYITGNRHPRAAAHAIVNALAGG